MIVVIIHIYDISLHIHAISYVHTPVKYVNLIKAHLLVHCIS